MFVTNWISTTKIQKISEITNFFRHYFLSRTEVAGNSERSSDGCKDGDCNLQNRFPSIYFHNLYFNVEC